MNYTDTIYENCQKHSAISWWPRFAFHYTDVTNAVSILESGYLYSRANATNMNIMRNDNASRQVINMTDASVASNVRFYFRPLTPTQYYNEGYKHPALRYDRDENANVPVPVFFVFDLEKLLSLPGVKFSEKSQAGHGSVLQSGPEAFSKLNFDYIYDIGFDNISITKLYRHAEIVHPNSLKIDSCIKNILCRNNLERTTLMNLLREKGNVAFTKYKNIIKVPKKEVFENNGLYVSDYSYHNNILNISFSDTYSSKKYIAREMDKTGITELKPIKVTIWLKWYNSRTIYHKESIEVFVDVLNPGSITFKELPNIHSATEISIEVYFDNKIMCYVKQPLDNAELWR